MAGRDSDWMNRIAVAALALCALGARAQTEGGGAAETASIAPRVEVFQDGTRVEPVGGEHVLARLPFVVRVAPGPGRLSVFATSSEEALGNARALWSAPLVAPLGAGSTSAPLSLAVTDAGLEFYAGLTQSFLDQWGPVLGAAQLGDYATLLPLLPREPNVLMTPRQFANVLRRKDGAQLLPVQRFGVEAVRASDVETLTLFLFFERPGEASQSWAIIDAIEVVRLRFLAADARAPERPRPLRTVLDCGSSGVVQAVRQSDFQRVERLMQQGVDPNTRSARNSVTLLMCAVGGLDVYSNAVWALLEGGAQVNARTARGETALLWAVRTGDRGITTPSRLNAVDQLLSRGADIDAADADGETPLLGAVWMGHAEIVATLLSAGADPAKANKAGETPLARARRLGMADIASLIALYLDF
jgi:hypothetical protein